MARRAALLLAAALSIAGVEGQAAVVTERVTVMQYFTADASAGSSVSYPGAQSEYHCIVRDGSNTPTYVKGTYGMYGYFEGPFISATQASITFYEITGVGNNPGRPISGAGLLTYSSGFATATGPYWPVGSSDQADSALAGVWNATGGVANATVGTGACLYSSTGKRPAQSPFVSRNTFAYNSPDSTNVFCSDIRESDGTTGTVLGSYTYTYTGADCIAPCTPANNKESGNYGEGIVNFIGRDAVGVTAVWHAVTGPFAGMAGSALYVVSEGGKRMAGFFCNANNTSGEMVRTSCFLETYPKAATNPTLGKCGAGYKAPAPQPKVVKLANGLGL